ncbi:MAG: sensor histidine kinase [Solirubrobacteraceae bacterium]
MSPRRSALLGVAAALLAAGAVTAVYGPRDGLLTLVLLVALGTPALVLAHVARARRRRLGSPRRQLAFGIAIAVGQLVVAIGAGVALMFVSAHDALVVGAIAAFAIVVAVRAVQLVGGAVVDDAEGMRRDLIAAVSHDLRTPITSLRLLTDAIADDVVDGETRRSYLKQMSTHLNAMSSLIDDLFELSRLEAGDIAWSLEQVRLEDLVGETVEAMRAQAAARHVQVRAELPPGLRPAQGDPEKLQRVLFNLIQNAIRHTPADGSVVVRAQSAGDAVEIEVADTGAGIADSDRDRIFEPFFRGGAQAARPSNGAGLGLAISRAIVEAHGGRIWLEDAPHGTRVRFSLPSA